MFIAPSGSVGRVHIAHSGEDHPAQEAGLTREGDVTLRASCVSCLYDRSAPIDDDAHPRIGDHFELVSEREEAFGRLPTLDGSVDVLEDEVRTARFTSTERGKHRARAAGLEPASWRGAL